MSSWHKTVPFTYFRSSHALHSNPTFLSVVIQSLRFLTLWKHVVLILILLCTYFILYSPRSPVSCFHLFPWSTAQHMCLCASRNALNGNFTVASSSESWVSQDCESINFMYKSSPLVDQDHESVMYHTVNKVDWHHVPHIGWVKNNWKKNKLPLFGF